MAEFKNEIKDKIDDILPIEYRLFKRSVKLTIEQREQLESSLYEDIYASEKDKQSKIDEIDTYEKARNLEPDEDNKMSPWPGASNYRDPLIGSHTSIAKDVIGKTITTDTIWTIKLPFAEEYELFLEQAMKYYTENVMNISDKITDIIELCINEPVSFAEVYDVAEEKPVKSTYEFFTLDEFTEEFSTPKSASLNYEEYRKIKSYLAEQIKETGSGKIVVEKLVYQQKVCLDIYNLSETYIIPFNAKSIDLAKGILFRKDIHDSDLKKYADMGYFDKDAVETTINTPKRYTYETNSYEIAKNIRNKVVSTELKYEPRRILKGVYSYDFGDGEEEYYIWFAFNEKKLLRIEKYERSMDMRNIQAFCPIPIHNSIVGRAFCLDLLPTQNAIDTFWNQFIDNNKIANIPSFWASLSENRDSGSTLHRASSSPFYPGCLFLLKNPGEFGQMRTSPLDTKSILTGISMLKRDAEVKTGATQMLSGRGDPQDPTAPGNKTAMQLGQSTMRMNAYLKRLRPSLKRLGAIILYKQVNIQPQEWRKFQLKFDKENINTNNKTAMRPQDISLDEAIVNVKSQSIEMNKDLVMNTTLFLSKIIMQDPRIMQNPMAVNTIYRKILESSEVFSNKEIDKILMVLEQLASQIGARNKDMPNVSAPPPEPPAPPEKSILEISQEG